MRVPGTQKYRVPSTPRLPRPPPRPALILIIAKKFIPLHGSTAHGHTDTRTHGERAFEGSRDNRANVPALRQREGGPRGCNLGGDVGTRRGHCVGCCGQYVQRWTREGEPGLYRRSRSKQRRRRAGEKSNESGSARGKADENLPGEASTDLSRWCV